MELGDVGVELVGEVGYVRRLITAGGQYHIVSLEPLITGADDESVGDLGDRVDAQTHSDRKIESGRVRLEVVGHLVLGRWLMSRSRELQTRQGIEVRGREESQRVPAFPPGIAGPLIRIQDHKRSAELGKVVADGQASLATADDNGLDLLTHEAKVRLRCWPVIAEIPHLRCAGMVKSDHALVPVR